MDDLLPLVIGKATPPPVIAASIRRISVCVNFAAEVSLLRTRPLGTSVCAFLSQCPKEAVMMNPTLTAVLTFHVAPATFAARVASVLGVPA